MEKIKNIRMALLCTAAVLLALLGILVGSTTLHRANDQIITEHRVHLEDIALSVDQNTANLFRRIRLELAFSLENCREDLLNSPIVLDDLVTDIMVLDLETPFDSYQGHVRQIRMLENSADDICLCADGDSRSYLVFLREGPDGLTYGALLDLASFYQKIVVNSITYHYWVVLYDPGSNLMLQNQADQPEYLLLDREEIAQRADGYTILQRRELEDGSGSDPYRYSRDDTGETVTCQISVLTSADSQNRHFAIGVAADTMNIARSTEKTILWLFLGAMLIMAGLALLLLGITARRKQADAIRERLALTEQLLEKQTELARNQRLEALGVMTSSIAHDFNNLLTPITGYSLMCMEKLPEDSELYDNLLAIYQAADKAKSLIRRLSALTRKSSDLAFTAVCPDEMVKRVLEIALPSKPKTVQLQTDLHCPGAVIWGNEIQVLQVLLNLLLNAFQAMERSTGTVTIRTEQASEDVVFTVADTGPGIAPEIMDRIFEPFFTTKDTGKGSGLGLAIAKQVAETHGGSLTAASQPGKGSVFTLRLPLRREENAKNVES